MSATRQQRLEAAQPAAPSPDWPVLLPALREAGERHDRDGSFPFDNLALLHQAGLLGLTVPAELGGQGQGSAASADAVGRVAQGCPATALILAMQLAKQAAPARDAGYPAAVRERIGRETVLAGNHGLSRHNGLERCWRDVQCGLVHVPQTDSAMAAAGKRVLD